MLLDITMIKEIKYKRLVDSVFGFLEKCEEDYYIDDDYSEGEYHLEYCVKGDYSTHIYHHNGIYDELLIDAGFIKKVKNRYNICFYLDDEEVYQLICDYFFKLHDFNYTKVYIFDSIKKPFMYDKGN